VSNHVACKATDYCKASKVKGKEVFLSHSFVTPNDASLGLSQRKITGATAATPAIAKVLGSVTPAMYRARAAAKNERPHDAASDFACSIYSPPSNGILKNEPSLSPCLVKETWQCARCGLLPVYLRQRQPMRDDAIRPSKIM
jgi:hypothetical protein